MNRKSVAATINSVCSDQFIKATSDRPTEYSFLPIFKRPYDGYTIGLDSDGYWCLENENRLWPVERQNAYCPMSRLIYTPVSEVISLIKDGLKQKRLPLKIAYTFPFDDFLIDLIRMGGFWRAKAVLWIDEGYPANDEVRLLLCGNDKQEMDWIYYHINRLRPFMDI